MHSQAQNHAFDQFVHLGKQIKAHAAQLEDENHHHHKLTVNLHHHHKDNKLQKLVNLPVVYDEGKHKKAMHIEKMKNDILDRVKTDVKD